METAYTRVTWRGVTVNARTRDALKYAQRLWRAKIGRDLSIELSQGSYSRSVAASGSTHHGGGAVDVRVRGLSTTQRKALVIALKKAGFAAWYRAPSSSWGAHIHAICIADKEMSPAAASQVRAFDACRDGLRGNRRDTTYRPDPEIRYSYKQGKPVPR